MAKNKQSGRGNSRADQKNPNNLANKAARDNRANQMNANNPAFRKNTGRGR